MAHVGAWLSNLIIPQDPARAAVAGRFGTWDLDAAPTFARDRERVEAGEICAATYSAETVASAPAESLVEELRLMCIAASFLTGRAVTIRAATPHSEWMPIRLDDGFPRDRAMTGIPAVRSSTDFESATGKMILALRSQASTNKVDVLSHHLVSALSGWCLEDVFLNVCTCMELIKWIGRRTSGDPKLSLNDALTVAGNVVGIEPHPPMFSKMRNDLIHDGCLSASHFPKKTREECADLTADVLKWVDRYIAAATGVSGHVSERFLPGTLYGLNAFSTFS